MVDSRPPQPDPTFRPYTRLIIIAGLLVVAVSCVVFLVNPDWSTEAQIWFGFGMILLLCAVLLQPNAVQFALIGRPVKYKSNAVIVSMAFIGILAFANYVSLNSDYEIDLTATGEFSLSAHTIKFLEDLSEPVLVMGFFKTGGKHWKLAEDYLERYSYYTNHLTYALSDPNLEPAVAQRYNSRGYGLIFIKGERHYQTYHVDEQSITDGLTRVTTLNDSQQDIPIPPKTIINRQLVLTPFQAGITFIVTVVAIPLVVFFVGAVMWWKQR